MWRDPGRVLVVVGFTLTTFSTVVVALRLYTRLFRIHAAGLSDFIMLAALISAWISTVLNYYQTKFGKDSRLSQVEKNPNSPQIQAALSGTLVTWFIYRPLYIVTLSLIKLSILTFYRTLVPPSTMFRSLRSFRYTVYALITFTILYAFAMILASIFQCTPISAAYSIKSSFSQIPGQKTLARPHCYKPTPLWVFTGSINFATDVLIFILPIPIITSLQHMPLRKKIGLFCVLSIGTLAIAASTVRMWILVLWSKDVRSQNKYGTDLLTWGQIEVNCGIVGASAMFLRPLFRDFFQRKENKLDVVNREAPERQGIEMKGREASVASSEIIIGGQTDVPEERSRTG